jgi:hypothetical protein
MRACVHVGMRAERTCSCGAGAGRLGEGLAVREPVEEALHKRALWGVPWALREWEEIKVSSTTGTEIKASE